MARIFSDTDQATLEVITSHLVLPRYLPSCLPFQYERKLVQLVLESIPNSDIYEHTAKLFRQYLKLHPLAKPNIISESLGRMQPCEMLGMYVREQNCCLVVYRPPENQSISSDEYIISTFPVLHDKQEIHGCDSDLQFTYPMRPLKVKWSDMLGSLKFAQQLCVLHDKDAEKRDANYVSKWLVTLLSDRQTTTATEKEFPSITKKVRDELVEESFQRSGGWVTMKVLLQLSLTVEFGQQTGRFIYKVMLLDLLAKVCNVYNDNAFKELDVDLINQTLAKLARRIEKLNRDAKELGATGSLYYVGVVDKAKVVISETRKKVDRQIKMLEKGDTETTQLQPIKNLNFIADLQQATPGLLKYIEQRERKYEPLKYDGKIKTRSFLRHNFRKKANAAIQIGKVKDEVATHFRFCDYENWFLNETSECTPTECRTNYFNYLLDAKSFYKDDPIGNSRMLLICLKKLAFLDKIATAKCPLLLNHRSGINPKVFEGLLLPQHNEMKTAFELQKYFEKRNAGADGPSLVEEDRPTTKSFAVKYAESNAEMQSAREISERTTQEEIASKRLEWTKKRKEIETIRARMQQMKCDYTPNKNGILTHNARCKLCALKKRINRIKIPVYERPLPRECHDQNAVVFEMRIPIEIECLRDVLYDILQMLDDAHLEHFEKSKLMHWVQCDKIKNAARVALMRISPPKKSKKRNLRVDIHPFDSFVIENEHSARYGSFGNKVEQPLIKEMCTFSVESGSPYENLQWTVNSTKHTQNEVLAKQCQCPVTLSLAEFKNFGSLRADGHRLQLRKLLAMIETEAISFETSSVLALVVQTLYEAGPIGRCNFNRESHEDLADPHFAIEMVEALDKFISQQQANWKHPLKLLITSLIAVRIFEFNTDESVADKTVHLLTKLRSVAVNWIENIQTAITEMHKGNSNETDEVSLRDKLMDVTIAGAITFFVHCEHTFFAKIFASATDGISALRVWLECIVTLNNNHLLSNDSGSKLSTKHLIFMRMVRSIGINIEPRLWQLIGNNPNDALDFVKKQWQPAENAQTSRYYRYSDCNQKIVFEIVIENEQNNVVIDLITGEFEVNNQPIAKLSMTIAKTPIFQRCFDQFVFEVRADAPFCFTTVQRYRGCSYRFRESRNGDIIITETRWLYENGIKKWILCELIPHEILKDDVPHWLVETYSHWWNKTENIIEFRPKKFSDARFSKPNGITYKLDLNTRRLRHFRNRHMLDVNSESYNRIADQLSRLESKKFIHVLWDLNSKSVKVELIRMNLKFEVVQWQFTYDLVSNEFSRMRVSMQQRKGTLFGLNRGLLLESSRDEKKLLLILPHGAIAVSKTSNYHTTVDIDVSGELSNPPYHTYRVDDFCKQIVSTTSNYSAWLYLAYLHAVTSHGTPEPFTGLSGTERALQILQSAVVWSPSPYDQESFKILQAIANLSPERTYEDKKCVKWPEDIPTHAAQDSFICIVTKLVENSRRLEELHLESVDKLDVQDIQTNSNIDLNERDYFRWLSWHPNLKIADTFIEDKVLRTKQSCYREKDKYVKNARAVSILYHENGFHARKDFFLENYLAGYLDGPVHRNCADRILSQSNGFSLQNMWISLYDDVRMRRLSDEELALVLSLLAHEGEDVDAILALQTVAQNAAHFTTINPPAVDKYNLNDFKFVSNDISSILNKFLSYPLQYLQEFSEKEKIAYNLRSKQIIQKLTEEIHKLWPCDAINSSDLDSPTTDIQIKGAIAEINDKLFCWYNNRDCLIFIQEVDRKLGTLRHANTNIDHHNFIRWHNRQTKSNWNKFTIDFESKMCQQIDNYQKIVKEAQKVYDAGDGKRVTSQYWWDHFTTITRSLDVKHLIDAQMYPRLVQSLVLPRLLSSNTNRDLKSIIGAFAVTLTHEQKERRVEALRSQSKLKNLKHKEVDLKHEEENKLYYNWKPSEHPEWLLFQIEQDLGIRRIQIEIAKRMMHPPRDQTPHSVMQLNMGEGKTAVIVPILASILSNGEKVCQITVLKSLFETNLKALRQYLGGLLNRRVYTFPCRRDMNISKYAEELIPMYEECKLRQGVILTLPEYRLSFQLKTYEMVCKGQNSVAKQFLYAHKWLNDNVQNVLDESDAILHAKYQLIYTVGNQLTLDGGADRWAIIQALLKRIPVQMKRLYDDPRFGKEKIEYDAQHLKNNEIYGCDKVERRNDVFTPCRILDDSVYDQLKEYIAEDFLDGKVDVTFPAIAASTRNDIKRMLVDKNIDRHTFERVMGMYDEKAKIVLLVLSGLLRFDVLKLTMTKRWRVNYGVNTKGLRKMAIPFKAKDVANEMTEFGHPDVALFLTHLSYYYSGLTMEQLRHVFQMLEKTQYPEKIYDKWISQLSRGLVDETLKSYTGINLEDPKQRDELLFPVFRYNMYVIDYWLSNAIFPHEAKTFKNKLMCTAWDLCSEHMKHPVTGFSGTNDTKNTLPITVAQNDLPELEQTNESVRQSLLRPENQHYQSLPANISGKEILERLTRDPTISVLLDCGALMLELNNEQVAREWLKNVPGRLCDAAVFFSDVLMVVDRDGVTSEFECSAYRDKLDRCLVYLDDVHTRGTDLKFPLDRRACVTLSGGITRDKTVQACMRMRLLGQGHSIEFWASFEADIQIRKICQLGRQVPTNEHIMKFICENSDRLEKENTVHWAAAAYNYAKKLSAHKLHDSDSQDGIVRLSNRCLDNEFTSLEEMYGAKDEHLMSTLSRERFRKLIEEYVDQPQIKVFIGKVFLGVQKKITNFIPDLKRHTGLLDEEQEKELEHELEEQRQIQRPTSAKPATPKVCPYLKKLIQVGETGSINFILLKELNTVMPVAMSLKHTKVFKSIETNAWSDHIYATKDFVGVLESSSIQSKSKNGSNENQELDDFIRPVWWLARVQSEVGKEKIILLSSFECNELLPDFRLSKHATLYMYRPRISQFNDNLLQNKNLYVTGMSEKQPIQLSDEIEVNVIAGAQYFGNDKEQDAYCNFLGLVPRPRSHQLQKAFETGIIEPNGFVPPQHRKYSKEIAERVEQCKFEKNPAVMAMKIVETRDDTTRNDTHVASILLKGVKADIVSDPEMNFVLLSI